MEKGRAWWHKYGKKYSVNSKNVLPEYAVKQSPKSPKSLVVIIKRSTENHCGESKCACLPNYRHLPRKNINKLGGSSYKGHIRLHSSYSTASGSSYKVIGEFEIREFVLLYRYPVIWRTSENWDLENCLCPVLVHVYNIVHQTLVYILLSL